MIFPAGDWPNYPKGSADDVQFQEAGAIELDNLVVQGIPALRADANVSTLIPALLPTFPVEIKIINPSWGLATRTQSVPAGITFTLVAIPNPGPAFVDWSGAINSTNAVTQFRMGGAERVVPPVLIRNTA